MGRIKDSFPIIAFTAASLAVTLALEGCSSAQDDTSSITPDQCRTATVIPFEGVHDTIIRFLTDAPDGFKLPDLDGYSGAHQTSNDINGVLAQQHLANGQSEKVRPGDTFRVCITTEHFIAPGRDGQVQATATTA